MIMICFCCSRPSSKHGLPTSAVGGVAELEAEEEQELQRQQKKLLAAITQQYHDGKLGGGVQFALPIAQGSKESSSIQARSTTESERLVIAETGKSTASHPGPSRFRASSAPFVPQIVVEGVGLHGTNVGRGNGVDDRRNNRRLGTDRGTMMSLAAVSTQAMKKRARKVRVSLLNRLAELVPREELKTLLGTIAAADNSAAAAIKRCQSSIASYISICSEKATVDARPTSREAKNAKRKGGANNTGGGRQAGRTAKQRARSKMLATFRKSTEAVETWCADTAATDKVKQRVCPSPVDDVLLHELIEMCNVETLKRDTKVFSGMIGLLDTLFLHCPTVRM